MAESPPPVPEPSLRYRLPGRVLAHTDEMLFYLSELAAMAQELREVGAALGSLLRAEWMPAGGRPCVEHLHDARLRVAEATEATTRVERALEQAVDNYERAEAGIERDQQLVAAGLAALAGPSIWLLALGMLACAPSVLAAVGFTALLGRVTGTDPIGEFGRRLTGDQRALTDPAVVRAVELGAASMDELGISMAGIPAPVALLLGDEGLGILGVSTTAAAAVAVGGGLGLLRETPVRIDSTRISTGGLAPTGIADRFSRIPEGDQVRIERYEAPGMGRTWLVYVGPTESFSPVASDEPWDLTSNVAGVAGLPAGSIRATELAMARAGIEPGDDVQFTGYSQGGLVAARLAGAGIWNAELVTFGAPTGSVTLPADVSGLAVRHSDDLVPALGGPHAANGLLQVEGEAYPRGVPIPDDVPLPAHHRSAYLATAQAIDRAASPELRSELARLTAVPQAYASHPGVTVTTWVFHAERGDGRSG